MFSLEVLIHTDGWAQTYGYECSQIYFWSLLNIIAVGSGEAIELKDEIKFSMGN